jgi:hypothetical protein
MTGTRYRLRIIGSRYYYLGTAGYEYYLGMVGSQVAASNCWAKPRIVRTYQVLVQVIAEIKGQFPDRVVLK